MRSLVTFGLLLAALSASAQDAEGPLQDDLRPRRAAIAANPPRAQGVIPHGIVGENPYVEYAGYGEGDCCGPGCCEPFFGGYWANFEMLMWWRPGMSMPPLVTSNPLGTAAGDSGFLPGATVLYGDEVIGGRMRIGGRVEAGLWFDRCQTNGIGFRFASIGREVNEFSLNSNDNPIIARPFFDVSDAGGNQIVGPNALLVAHPTGGPNGELTTGDIFVRSTSEVYSTDVLWRHAMTRDACGSFEWTFGYQTTRINESVLIRSNTQLNGTITIQDQFSTRNQFDGGSLGFMMNRDWGTWTFDGAVKIAIGNTHEQVQIAGQRTPVPAQGANLGLLALTSNIGNYTQNDFTVVPEVNLRLGCRVAQWTKITVGYSLIYWSTVARPNDQIDTTINPTQIGGNLVGDARPRFNFNTSDFWVQGLNLGLQWDF